MLWDSLRVEMRNPRDNLQTLIHRGKQLQDESHKIAAEAKLSGPKVQVGVGLLDLVFDMSGHKRRASSAGKYLVLKGLIASSQALSVSFDQWFSEVLSQLRMISVAKKNITPRGNSSMLTARFAKAKASKRLDTKIAKAIGVLEAVSEEELVCNDEILE
jgi:hypothetical protein